MQPFVARARAQMLCLPVSLLLVRAMPLVGCRPSCIAQPELLQKLNHFPGMLEIARKKALARNLAAMR